MPGELNQNRQDRWFEAQCGVMGACLISPELVPRMLAECGEEDFTGELREIYCACRRLVAEGRPVDVITVRDLLGAQSSGLLAQLMRVTPTAANFEVYAALCRDQSRLARMQALATELLSAHTMDEARETAAGIQALTVERQGARAVSMADALAAFFLRPDRREKDYLTFGFPSLNRRLFVRQGDFVILGGYPSAGKSALMLQLAWHMSEARRVGIFSLETGREKLFDRLMCHVCGLDMGKVKRGELTQEDWSRVVSAGEDIGKRPVELVEAAGMTVTDVLGMSLARGYQVVFVDYLQLLLNEKRERGGNRTEEVSRISMALHTMAQRHNIAVFALSQLSRPERNPARRRDGAEEGEGRGQAAPELSSLRESGQLEQDADVVMLLYRLYPNSKDDQRRRLKIAKNKEGELGMMDLEFDGRTQTFSRSTFDEIRSAAALSKGRGSGFGEMKEPEEGLPFPVEGGGVNENRP